MSFVEQYSKNEVSSVKNMLSFRVSIETERYKSFTKMSDRNIDRASHK